MKPYFLLFVVSTLVFTGVGCSEIPSSETGSINPNVNLSTAPSEAQMDELLSGDASSFGEAEADGRSTSETAADEITRVQTSSTNTLKELNDTVATASELTSSKKITTRVVKGVQSLWTQLMDFFKNLKGEEATDVPPSEDQPQS